MSNQFADLQGSPRQAARWQKAQQHLLAGRPELARAAYEDLLAKFPGAAQLWFELAFAAGRQLDFVRANEAGLRAAARAPRDANLLVLLGQQAHWLRQLDRARACFQAAVAADPASTHPQLSLADWYEREGRLTDAAACVQAALARQPHDPQIHCLQALVAHRQGRDDEAEKLLRGVIQRSGADANIQYTCRQQMAAVADHLGRHEEALRWLGEAKSVLRRTANLPKLEQDYERATRRRRELVDGLTPAMLARWRAEPFELPGGQRLAFLGGHPRSGTTLIEQILGAHPRIAAYDEPTAFIEEVAGHLDPQDTSKVLTAAALDALPAAHLAQVRARYLRSLRRAESAGPNGELLLDKNPSPTGLLPLWLRVFPGMKVLIALRDPRDVIISCYFQNLRLNPTNANFLSLERTARHYMDLMDVWLRIRELGGCDWLETRYEDTVGGLAAEGRRMTEFLGLAWHPHQVDYLTTARRTPVFAPTYAAVAQPIHGRAVARWQNYAAALAPLQERLAPYCRRLGY